MHIPLRISGFYTRAKFIQPLKERNVPELGYELLLAAFTADVIKPVRPKKSEERKLT